MKEKLVKSVPIELDRTRHLKFDLNALCSFEETTGKPIPSIDFNALSVTHVRALLWAGLIHEDPELSLTQVGAMISLDGLDVISRTIVEALSTSMPEQAQDSPLALIGQERHGTG